MTFGEKLDLVKALRFIDTTADRFSDKDLLRRLDSCPRHGSFKHVCSVDNHGLAKAQVLTNITWNDDTHTLRVDNTYTFQDKRTYTDILSTFKNRGMGLLRIELSWHSTRTPFECPHKDPTRWLQRFFTEAGLTSHSLDHTQQTTTSFDDCDFSGEKNANVQQYQTYILPRSWRYRLLC